MQVKYSIKEAFESMDNFLDEFVLDTMALPLGASIWMSLEMALDSRRLDIAEVEEKMFEFTISLLGATIQDGGTRERSDVEINYLIFRTLSSFFVLSNIKVILCFYSRT